jgi:hypothetical protein
MQIESGFGSGVIGKKFTRFPKLRAKTAEPITTPIPGRNNARKTVVLLHDPRFLFHLQKDIREKVIVIWIIFASKANERFGAISIIGIARRRANGCCAATSTETRA